MQSSSMIEALVSEAIVRSSAGEPTVLDVEGHAGFGKSHLARSVARGFSAERVLRATAYEDTQSDPLSLLQQLGIDPASTSTNALSASRALGARLDSPAFDGPMLVVVDDLQWADPESIDALGVLMERIAGQQLLVVACHRPVGSRHARWVERLDRLPSAVRVVLDGLDSEATLQFLRERDRSATTALAEALRRHTGGSPLFLRTLLHEYDLDELLALSARDDLPATSALVATMGQRLSRLDPDAVATLSAIAVIGAEGADMFTLRAVAEVPDTTTVLDLLVQDGLVHIDRTGPTVRARIFHGVVQAAVYNNIPPATRERMHAIAAARLRSPGERLRHRVAAARTADDGLAADLAEFADALHEDGRYREAARFRRQAAQFRSVPPEAAVQLLGADMESIFALDLEDVSVDERDVSLDARSRFVIGAKRAAQMRFVEASDILCTLTDDDITSFDPLTAYRARVLRAWSYVSAGRSAAMALHDLATARAGPVTDAAVGGQMAIAQGQATQLAAPPEQRLSVMGVLGQDRASLASTPQGVAELAWRGSVMSLTGMPEEAIGDLSIVTSRFGDGSADFGDGVFHALLGFAYFINGQWPRAAMMIDLSRAGRFQYAVPLTAAIDPLSCIVSSDAAGSRAALVEARRIRIDGPQVAAVHAGDIVEVLSLCFLGEKGEQAAWLSGRIRDFGSPDDWADEQVAQLWYVVQAIGADWAERPEAVRRWTQLLRTVDPLPWSGKVADWLDARADRSPAGDVQLARLADIGLPELPALNGLLQFDAAKRAHGSDRVARESAASSALRNLGADALAGRVANLEFEHQDKADLPAQRPRNPELSFLSPLSEREREVAALILEGLTYAQTAKELFITPSTVSFHLSRIYAKTGTTSRHELIETARRAAR